VSDLSPFTVEWPDTAPHALLPPYHQDGGGVVAVAVERHIREDAAAPRSSIITHNQHVPSPLPTSQILTMAVSLIALVLLLLRDHRSLASPTPDPSIRPHGTCQQLDLFVSAAADSAVYDIPQVNNDIDARAWAIFDSTRTTHHDTSTILRNTTTSGTFKIHAQLCVPFSSAKKDIIQIATHGAHYDSRYWDSAYQPSKHSYVEASLKAGYSILTYDRLGAGQSDHPDAYTVTQAPLELEILHQLSLMTRNGTLYNLFRAVANPTENTALANLLTTPAKVVHIGHSFGSFLTSAFIARYGSLSDGAIITGYLLTENLASAGSTTFSLGYASALNLSGYVEGSAAGVQSVFFGGNTSTAFTPELLAYGNSIKQPLPIGEIASAFWLLGNPASNSTSPVLYQLPEFDFYVCRGDCKGLADEDVLREMYHPNSSAVEVAVQPNMGHALPLHRNATGSFEVVFGFLGRNGL
jgi:pimeloyl-ACP methyl ester carboxylesterase